jgi:hypothetical protein
MRLCVDFTSTKYSAVELHKLNLPKVFLLILVFKQISKGSSVIACATCLPSKEHPYRLLNIKVSGKSNVKKGEAFPV